MAKRTIFSGTQGRKNKVLKRPIELTDINKVPIAKVRLAAQLKDCIEASLCLWNLNQILWLRTKFSNLLVSIRNVAKQSSRNIQLYKCTFSMVIRNFYTVINPGVSSMYLVKLYFSVLTRFIFRSSSSSMIHILRHCTVLSYVWMYVLSLYILYVHFTDSFITFKIFKIKIYKLLFEKKVQKSSLFLYRSWFSTISCYISKNIHFTDVHIKCKKKKNP